MSSLPPNDINPPRDLFQIYSSQVHLIRIVCIISVMGFYIWLMAFSGVPALRDGSTQVKFTGLIAVHLVLHWFSPKVQRRQRLAILYLFGQIILLFYMGLVINYTVQALFLAPLLAEIVIIFEAVWLIPIVLVLSFALIGVIVIFNALTPLNDHTTPGPLQVIMLQLPAFVISMVLVFWSYIPSLAAYFLVIRGRRQAGSLLVRLDNAHRQLAAYAEQVEQLTVTAERARIARELHDTLAQGVAGLILQLEALDAQIERGDNERATGTLLQIKTRARTTLENSRLAIDDLRMMPNQPGMLLSGIADEIRQFSSLTGVPCTLNVPPSLTLPTSTTEHILRFVSEGLANIAKHAAASTVNIQMKVQERDVLLEIQDDGVGFDPAAGVQKRGHYGLLGLQERARLVGGKFEVESALNKGTTLRMYLPKLNNGTR